MLDRLEADARPAEQQLPLQGDIASTAFWRQTEPPALLYVSPAGEARGDLSPPQRATDRLTPAPATHSLRGRGGASA